MRRIWKWAVGALIVLSSVVVTFGFIRAPRRVPPQPRIRFMKLMAGLNRNDFENMANRGGSRTLADLLGDANAQQLRSSLASPAPNGDSATDRKKDLRQESKEKLLPFSRIVNIRQIPWGKPVRCRLLAKDSELRFVAEHLNVVGLTTLAANVTLQLLEDDRSGVEVSGDIFVQLEDPFAAVAAEAITSDDEEASLEKIDERSFSLNFDDSDHDLFAIRTSFVSHLFFDPSAAILDQARRTSKQGKARERILDFNHADDFDDEIPPSGDIDVGDIVVQYLAMEISS